jgi:hypothetical protein
LQNFKKKTLNDLAEVIAGYRRLLTFEKLIVNGLIRLLKTMILKVTSKLARANSAARFDKLYFLNAMLALYFFIHLINSLSIPLKSLIPMQILELKIQN